MVGDGYSHLLDGFDLTRDLSEQEVSRLCGFLHRRQCAPGVSIISAEQPGEIAYFILRGAIRVQVDQANGSCVILAILGPGDIVGEMSLIDHLGRSATAITLEESTLMSIDREAFWECFRTMPAIGHNLARILCRRLRMANDRIQSLAALDVDGRIARQLLSFAEEYGRPAAAGATIPFRLTQEDLAGLVGASRVRVNQVLVGYRREGILSRDRRHRITILDLDALRLRCE